MFYTYNVQPPQSYIRCGQYDIGCGGSVDWYITEHPVPYDMYGISYSGQQFLVICQLYNTDVSIVADGIELEIKKFDANDDNTIEYYFLSSLNESEIIEQIKTIKFYHDGIDDGSNGAVNLIDLHSNKNLWYSDEHVSEWLNEI